jgi:CheY-like chemotaxis protein
MSNILIVDDDDGIRSFLHALLAEEGFQVRTACDGAEALKILQCEGDWVVLLDMRMPGLDGRDVLHELEANPRLHDHARVALMSAGWGLTQPAPDPRPTFVEAVLDKPFELDTILNVVTQLAS